ncbi:PTS sugar transporter subunit IIA [Singulisphaera acidiphila]|uniref:DNA-binding protein, excisionase family n=1 Tax=Singulisphaera acidiphila (strain ATCC BAA-1392 / DSM 18658 / VKM B-2454 / MOB10) TaxID=886293 RepID=L0DEC2_SINAD|nr:PTS sugar transporter subunit IIA [Singulisphaera acidiphila]AGA27173.1 DNA-binding protein, excisionase family [Singulisphaera acidiphila DSM 18658]
MNLSVRDTASLLAVSEKTIYRWIKQQTIPAYRVQDQYRFNRAEILEWATARRLKVSSEIFQEPEAADQPIPSLLAALEAGGVFYRVSGFDKESVLREVVDLLRLPEEVDRDFLLRVLIAREAIAPTAVGDGIAIPHVRNPVVLHVGRPMITLCFLDQPIEYGALDGKPVHTLFTIISPTTRAHLHLTSKLSFVLRDPGFRRSIERPESRPEIFFHVERAEKQLATARPRCVTGEGADPAPPAST